MDIIQTNTNSNGQLTVSARDLYTYLEVRDNFTDWAKRMFEYGFIEGVDFIGFFRESTGGRPSADYELTIDCAKEISMLQRSERGKEARRYFIQCEKKLKNSKVEAITKSDLAKMILESEEEKEAALKQLSAANATIEQNKPKVLLAEALSASDDSKLIKDLAIRLTEIGIPMGQNRLYQWLRENGYLLSHGEYYNRPAQRYLEAGLFSVKAGTYLDGEVVKLTSTTKVTGKGMAYFLKKFIHRPN